MNDIVLKTHDLMIGYRRPRQPARAVVSHIDVGLKAGELVCLIGPNGAGKSTLMRTLAGMQPPLAGSVSLEKDDVYHMKPAELARCLSIVLTERVEVGVLSAYALAALGRYPYTGAGGALTPHDEKVVRWAMEAVGAAHLAARDVGELSDGERQKVMIARALAQEPVVMLLDEPTAFLDLPRRAEMMQLLRHLARDSGRAVLLSTHDLDLALRSAARIWLLPAGGPLQTGAPEDLVLSGAFQAAFQGEGVTFDSYNGSFRVQTRAAGQVELIGDGLPALWTARALEREGFCAVRNGQSSPVRIEVLEQDGQPRWRLLRSGVVSEFASLYQLMETLSLRPKEQTIPS
jgi:iron complex transport system ATP-binding protein